VTFNNISMRIIILTIKLNVKVSSLFTVAFVFFKCYYSSVPHTRSKKCFKQGSHTYK